MNFTTLSLSVLRAQCYWLKVRVFSLFGRYRCSVCEHRVFKFYPLPAYYRQKALEHGARGGGSETCNEAAYTCPFCGASDRDRLIALFLEKFIRENTRHSQSFRIVDFAPSFPLSGFIRRTLEQCLPTAKYRTADLFMAGADDKVDLMDMRTYASESFDFFICSHVLEHVSDDRRALSELFRITKPEGTGILLVPIDLDRTVTDEDPAVTDIGERWRRFGQDDHVRAYAKTDFIARIRGTGFDVREWTVNDFSVKEFDRAGVQAGSVLYIVNK